MEQPRIHQNTVAGVIEALETIFGKQIYADKVIERILKVNRKWGSRDRGFVAENTYDMVRWWRLLWALYGKEPTLKRKELWNLFGIWWMYKGNELPDWPKFDAIRDFDIEEARKALPDSVAIKQSFPDWIDERMSKEIGDAWPLVAQASNHQADLVVRANTLKTNRDELRKRLDEEGIPSHPVSFNDTGLVLEKRANTFRLNSFQDGWFEVQDGGSQMIAPFAEVEPGMRVIDSCAGAGGKSLHLAAMMDNKGSIIAMDVEGWKLNELKKRARRNGVHNIETRVIDNLKTIKRLENSADRLLMDVPCSGTGVFKRNPDTKWKLQPEHLESTIRTQREILKNYPRMLKPGGILVYATCSLFRSENEDQVEWFLQEFGDTFTLLDQKRISPETEATDGFFMAKFKKKEE
ncbi:MAG: RsmB/NOP family class I SAM-dependent RNA methyltransferase [Bacteroidota bacterium]|nr:RsmB/NOP family class I SAM-dependent RNA methyltransferase [Bacteroidota bacterium]MDX5505187.1 RsmB/NOP family class I SAM-dependent RNA methyltransferase [Bacteroidota bacterium]